MLVLLVLLLVRVKKDLGVEMEEGMVLHENEGNACAGRGKTEAK